MTPPKHSGIGGGVLAHSCIQIVYNRRHDIVVITQVAVHSGGFDKVLSLFISRVSG